VQVDGALSAVHFEFLRAAVVGDYADGQVGILGQADGKLAARGAR
jgi:hypothetical protein